MPQSSNRDKHAASPTQKQSNDTMTTASGDVSRAKDALVEGAQQLTEELKGAAGDAANQAKKVAETKLDAGRDFAAEHLGSVAQALRKTGDELGKNDSALTSYVGQAASAVEDVSEYLQTKTLSQLMSDLEGFARREPAMFLGGSFVAGIMGGRFLKSATPAPTTSGTPRDQSMGAQATSRHSLPALPAYAGAGTSGPRSATRWAPQQPESHKRAMGSTSGIPSSTSGNPSYPGPDRATGAAGSSREEPGTSPQARTNGANGESDRSSHAGTR
jgi:hypothetical protein